MRIEEIRLYAGRIAIGRQSWSDYEDVVDIRRVRLDLTQSHCAGDIVLLATVGLHALTRRCERGTTSGLTPILADLQTLGEAYAKVLQGPNSFRVPVSGGGHWRGVVMRSPDSRPSLTVRTFVGRE